MKNILKSIIGLVFLVGVMLPCFGAEDPTLKINEYYAHLISVVNANMDKPDDCLREVGLFLSQNGKFINGARALLSGSSSSSGGSMMSSSSNSSKKKYPLKDRFDQVFKEFRKKHYSQARKIEDLGIHAILKPLE